MYYKLLTPSGNNRGPAFTEAMLKTLHAADIQRREGLTFRIDSHKGDTCLGIEVPVSLKSVVLHELQDSYPGLTVQPQPLPTTLPHTWTLELRKHLDSCSLAPFEAFTDETHRKDFADPLSGILTAMQSGRSGRLSFSVELTIRPATIRRLKSANRLQRNLAGNFSPQFARRMYLHFVVNQQIYARATARLIAGLTVRRAGAIAKGSITGPHAVFECRLVLRATAAHQMPDIASKRLEEIAGAFARFDGEGKLIRAKRPQHRGFLLNSAEVAGLWHPPTASTDSVARVQRSHFKELEPSSGLHDIAKPHGIVIGQVCYRNDRSQLRIPMSALKRHMLVIGKTGCGKSTFLLNMIAQLTKAGQGVILIDPHGDLAQQALRLVPNNRKNDVVYFDTTAANPLGFNPLVGPNGVPVGRIADGVLTAFQQVFGIDESSAPRLLYIFENCLLSLIGTRHASLLSLRRLLVDDQFRRSIIAAVQNDAVRDFWINEFQKWPVRERTMIIASLQNKIGALTTNEQLVRILNPSRKGVQLRNVMDEGKILFCNLSKGLLGHKASNLLGSLLLSSIHVNALGRANVSETERVNCTVVVDEFASYLSSGNTTMSEALSESRKYAVGYVLSTQMLEGQLDSATLASVLGNCGSTLCMTVGPRDAEVLSRLLANEVSPEDLMAVPRYHGYLNLNSLGPQLTISITTISV